MRKIEYGEIDVEVRELVRQLNMVPGLRTTSCCFGHDEGPAMIFLTFKAIRHLNNFLWAGCWRWFAINIRGAQWLLELDNGDTPRNFTEIRCCLITKEIGTQAAVDKLVEGIAKFNLEQDHSNWAKWFWWDMFYPFTNSMRRIAKAWRRRHMKPEPCPTT
jgi:hypothetical protein